MGEVLDHVGTEVVRASVVTVESTPKTETVVNIVNDNKQDDHQVITEASAGCMC